MAEATVTQRLPRDSRFHLERAADPGPAWKTKPPGFGLRTLYDDGGAYRILLVRYARGIAVPGHVLTEDEHVFVLSGRLRDDYGDHGPGVYLFHPSGLRHAYWTSEGCLLLVHRLGSRRSGGIGGAAQKPLRIDTASAAAEKPGPLRENRGSVTRSLFDGPPGKYRAALLEVPPGAPVPVRAHPGDEHVYVLSGNLECEHGCYGAGTYVFNPPGAQSRAAGEDGCRLLVHWRA